MNNIKGKYDVILGFVTLVVSLSAFKDELKAISINISIYKLLVNFTLADYFLAAVVGFSFCLYLYVVEHVVTGTKIGNWKIFEYFVKLAFYIFVFIVLSPLIILLLLIWSKISLYISNKNIKADNFLVILNIIVAIISAAISLIVSKISNKLYKERKENIRNEAEEKQIKEIDTANKLFNDGYFSQSILESFRAIETFLYAKIIEKGIRVQPNKVIELIRIAQNENIIDSTDVSKINKIREMRNAAAHTNVAYNKEQAEFALEVVRSLFHKS